MKTIKGDLTVAVRAVQEAISAAIQPIQTLFAEFPPKMREASRILAEHGWFWDPDFSLPDMITFSALFTQGDAGAAERTLTDHYRTRYSQDCDDPTFWYPRRSQILVQAFAAHQRGDYALSVPVFLAQADGICAEHFDVDLYSRRNGLPRTAQQIETIVRRLSVCAMGRPSRPRALDLGATHIVGRMAHDPYAQRRDACCRPAVEPSPTGTTMLAHKVLDGVSTLPAAWPVSLSEAACGHPPGPMPIAGRMAGPADYAPSLRFPWRAAIVSTDWV